MFKSIALASIIAITGALAPHANASTPYCHVDVDNDYVCLHDVKIHRTYTNKRWAYLSVNNGGVYRNDIDCNNRYQWHRTSLFTRACTNWVLR